MGKALCMIGLRSCGSDIMEDQRVRYVIDIDNNHPPCVEIALTEFMSGVFDLAEKSNL